MTPVPRDFQIDFDGRKYSGSYTLDGAEMRVGSAYGSKSQRVSKSADLEKVAKLLLRQILEARAK